MAKANEEAKEQYEKAIGQKEMAFLKQEMRVDIFNVRRAIVYLLHPQNVALVMTHFQASHTLRLICG